MSKAPLEESAQAGELQRPEKLHMVTFRMSKAMVAELDRQVLESRMYSRSELLRAILTAYLAASGVEVEEAGRLLEQSLAALIPNLAQAFREVIAAIPRDTLKKFLKNAIHALLVDQSMQEKWMPEKGRNARFSGKLTD